MIYDHFYVYMKILNFDIGVLLFIYDILHIVRDIKSYTNIIMFFTLCKSNTIYMYEVVKLLFCSRKLERHTIKENKVHI